MIKKFLFVALTCVLFAGYAQAQSINWNVATNLVQGATVITSSNDAAAATITDGDIGTSWQAVAKANNVAGNPDWVIIDLGASKSVADVELVQENALATQYDFYFVADVPQYATRQINIGTEEVPALVDVNYLTEEWYSNNTPIYTHNEDEAGYDKNLNVENYDTHTINAEGRYMVLVAKAYNVYSTGYGWRIWEVRATENTSDINDAKAIALADVSVKNGETVSTTVTAVSVGGRSIADISSFTGITLDIDKAQGATITDKGNGTFEITGTKVGGYTLTAKATLNSVESSATATLNVLFSWDKATDVALNKTATASRQSELANKAIDGSGTGWEVGADIKENTWYQVDLGGDYKISAIGVQWQLAYASHYKYHYATETDENGEPIWTQLIEVNETKNVDNTTIFTDVFSEVTARYIKLECIQSAVWGMHFYNFKVAGTPSQEPVPTTMVLTSSANGLLLNETATISAVVKDQYGSVMDITPSLTITSGTEVGTIAGNVFTAVAKGQATITATAGELEETVDVVVAADKETYIKALSAETMNNLSVKGDGSLAIDGDINTTAVFPNAEMPSSITIDLGNSYNLDMITIDWERACASDFTVKLALDNADLDSAEPIYVVANRADPNGNIQDRIYGSEMKAVRYVKIEMTGAATEWDTKIFEVSPYGVVDPVTAVESVSTDKADANTPVDVYTVNGALVRKSVLPVDAVKNLMPGCYIVGKEKILIK